MSSTLLPDLQPNNVYATVRVQISRKWEFRVQRDDGPIQHVDLVLADEKGSAMHCEIPAAFVAVKSPLIEVENVYDLSKFKVLPSKRLFKPVDTRFMIRFTQFTEAKVVRNPPSTFPRYVYKLTPLDQLEEHVDKNEFFYDVLSVIKEVTPLKTPSETCTSVMRDVTIADCSGHSMTVTLWGHRAATFSLKDVYNSQEAKQIVIMFVGCLPKQYQGSTYLSGTTACHWYINPEIPEAADFHIKFQD